MNILLGVTGSVAAKLTNKFIQKLIDAGHTVKIVFTGASLEFAVDVRYSNEDCDTFSDEDEWSEYTINDKVLHIDLTKWADVFIIAPCSANTLAKLANGICDNLLTCCARAWDFRKQFIIAPAMNTFMFTHPSLLNHYDTITSWGIIWVGPITKELFCGDTGVGAMAEIDHIIKQIK